MDKIIVGLGNPGSRYEDTRHNVGWMVLDRLAERAGSTGRARARDAAATVRGRYDDLDLLLVKPTTFMNLSGVAVRKVLARERAPLDDLLVVVDDFALPLGRLRMRERGSAGGHNGLRSIIGELGTQEFARLRVGIGEPAPGAARRARPGRVRGRRAARLDVVLDAAADASTAGRRTGPAPRPPRWNAWRPAEPGEPDESDDVAAARRASRPSRARCRRHRPDRDRLAAAAPPSGAGPGDGSP